MWYLTVLACYHCHFNYCRGIGNNRDVRQKKKCCYWVINTLATECSCSFCVLLYTYGYRLPTHFESNPFAKKETKPTVDKFKNIHFS